MDDYSLSPWQHTEFHRYFYLDRNRLLLPRIASLLFVLFGLYLTFHYLADPDWHMPWPRHTRIRGKGAIFVLIFLFIVSLPAWIRVPFGLITLGETFVYNVAMLVWTFDKRPDFAIGPYGIYGIDYLKYRRIPWRMVERLQINRYTNKLTLNVSTSLVFVGKTWDPTQPNVAGGIREPKIKVLKYEGGFEQDILDLAKKFHPELQVTEVEFGG